jgi:hypothetical protein
LAITFQNKHWQVRHLAITVSAVARNLWTIMKHTDNIDPESGFANRVLIRGIEGTSVPQTRTYGFNLNFKLKN